jgi:hypothetical protein
MKMFGIMELETTFNGCRFISCQIRKSRDQERRYTGRERLGSRRSIVERLFAGTSGTTLTEITKEVRIAREVGFRPPCRRKSGTHVSGTQPLAVHRHWHIDVS